MASVINVCISCSGDEVTSASVMEEGLRKLLSRFASGTSPIVRQSCCIWLLSILKHAAKHPGIQVKLNKCVFLVSVSEIELIHYVLSQPFYIWDYSQPHLKSIQLVFMDMLTESSGT